MKLLFIAQSLGGGGAERVVSMLVGELSKRHEVSVVTFEDVRDYPVPESVPVDSLDFSAYAGGARDWLTRGVPAALKLARVVHRRDPDVCISFMTFPNLFNILASQFHRKPTVLSVRAALSSALPTGTRAGEAVRTLVRKTYPGRPIVAISHGVGRDLVENFGVDPVDVTAIHNPITPDRVIEIGKQPLPEQFADVFEDPVTITVGRLAAQKRHDALVRAFSVTKERAPNARLVIVGSGPLHDHTKECAEEAGLRVWTQASGIPADRSFDVILAGRVLDPFHMVRAARVFAFSSSFEGLGNVLLEALAVGTPPVSSDCPHGPREILDPGYDGPPLRSERRDGEFGVLLPAFPEGRVEPGAPLTKLEEMWGEALADVMLDQELVGRLSNAGPGRADEFRVETIAQRWEELLERLLR